MKHRDGNLLVLPVLLCLTHILYALELFLRQRVDLYGGEWN
jgi:hypothetical protein